VKEFDKKHKEKKIVHQIGKKINHPHTEKKTFGASCFYGGFPL
jgi:hypothetical protein